ncbi:universal stress protein [Aestuariivirga sp.]|uniref:universal stress protein n=1 Tax=Aestuariivirga sp. TaxID=2650926 RepID=UPI00391CDDED
MGLTHIVCAVDGSEPSLRAVVLAAEMAKGLGARLSVVTVRSFVLGRSAAAGLPTPEEAAAVLEAAVELARQSGCGSVAAVELKGRDAAVSIADYADEHGAGMIVVGSTGKDALRRFALGSTSIDLLRKSACPVTIVH